MSIKTTRQKRPDRVIKTKYLKITAEDLAGNYQVDINMNGTVSYKDTFVEYGGRKYWCRKIGDKEWTFIEIDNFPFAELPKDFRDLQSL